MKKITNMIKFLVSLPELSRPGVTEEDVCSFLEKYANNVPKIALKTFSKIFIDLLCDQNAFSKLELMTLANTLKNTFDCKHDFPLYDGLSNVLVYYNREVLEFGDLIKTVKDARVKNGYLDITSATEHIQNMLENLNEKEGAEEIFNYPDEYRHLINQSKQEPNSMDLEAAILTNSERSEAYFALSEFFNDEDFKAYAIEVLDDLIKTNPCKPVLSKAHLSKAKLYVEMENYRTALQDLEKVDNNDFHKYLFKDVCLYQLNLRKPAIEKITDIAKKAFYCYIKPGWQYYKSTKKVSGGPKAHILAKKGMDKLHNDDLYGAVKDFHKARKLEPTKYGRDVLDNCVSALAPKLSYFQRLKLFF